MSRVAGIWSWLGRFGAGLYAFLQLAYREPPGC